MGFTETEGEKDLVVVNQQGYLDIQTILLSLAYHFKYSCLAFQQ